MPRDPHQLPFLARITPPYPKLLLDTTVYIDTLQGLLPSEMHAVLRTADLWHSTVTESEISTLSGLLDPEAAGTQQVIRQIAASIEKRSAHRVLNPDRDIWREAGVLAGLMARLQGYGKGEQRRIMNDSLIFLTSVKHGCAVLTRNVRDFDFLTQLVPSGRVVFYERG